VLFQHGGSPLGESTFEGLLLVWIWVSGAIVLAATAIGLVVVAMAQADRRARRMLFRALGLDEATVDLLMARNGDVLAELALVRRGDTPETPAVRGPPSIRLVHPVSDAGAPDPTPGDDAPGRPGRRLREQSGSRGS
jgi:hypothetical protein